MSKLSVMDQAARELSAKKLALLVSGEVSDLVIHTKLDKPSKKEKMGTVQASKYDLMLASEYLALALSKLPPSQTKQTFDMIGHDHETIKLLVEFVFLSGHLLSEIRDLEQCFDLAKTAVQFKISELEQLCADLLKSKFLKPDNVWKVFNELSEAKAPALCSFAATKEYLSERTRECMKQPQFLNICDKALKDFLTIEKLQIASEMDLVNACVDYAKAQSSKTGRTSRDIFRLVALPHLRLQCLNAEELAKIDSYLEPKEAIFLARNLACDKLRSLLPADDPSFNYGFNLEEPPIFDKIELTVNFLPETTFLIKSINRDLKWQDHFLLSSSELKFVLTFQAPRKMTITKVETLLPLRKSHSNTADIFQCMVMDPKTCFEKPKSAKITTSLLENDEMNLVKMGGHIHPWATFKAFNFVEKDSFVSIEMIFDSTCFFRKVSMDIDNPTDIPFTFKLFSKGPNDTEWRGMLNQGINIFRSLTIQQN